VKGQNNVWWQNAFLTCYWSILRSDKLEQLQFKLEKNIGIEKHAGKVKKYLPLNCCYAIIGGPSLMICILMRILFCVVIWNKKKCKEDKISTFELLLCNYWGALFADLYLHAFFYLNIKDIHIESSKQFKWNLYFYVSGQSGPFWAVLKLL
jgi:hypothetical protein